MPNDLTYAQMTLCASLWLKPGSLKELSSRLDKSEYGVYLLLKLVRDKKWIYQKGEIYYCYKKQSWIF